MNRYIKIQLLKDGKPQGKSLYTYKTSLDVQLGEVVQVNEHLQGVVVSFVPVETIPDPTNVKSIAGQIKKEDAE